MPSVSDAEKENRTRPPSKVDTSKPLTLDKWRAVHEKGKAARKVVDRNERIAELQVFVNEHGDHEQLGELLGELIDALIDRRNFDPNQLARYVKRLAEADEDDSNHPADLVGKYHIKHTLPLDSGLELLAMTRARLEEERADLELEANEWYREYQELRVNYKQTASYTIEGQLLLVHNQPRRALAALKQARKLSDKFPKDIVVYAGGEPLKTLEAGAMDKLYVLQAAAHHKLGDDLAAKDSLQNVVGFLAEVDIRAMYNDLRENLGVEPKAAQAVKTAAELAQDFSLEDLDGNQVKLSSYKGKVVMLAFWASWCGPCLEELPVLQKFARTHRDKGVEVLAINLDSYSDRAKVRPFVEGRNFDFKVLFRDDEQLSSYDYEMMPTLYVIDRDGRVAHTRAGYVPDLPDKLEVEVLPLIESHAESERELFVIEQAPANWDVLWKQAVSGGINALTIAPPLGAEPGEVGAVGRNGLMRWTTTGEASEPKLLEGWNNNLRVADLDGDGKREWISGSWSSIRVLDSTGEMYWQYEGHGSSVLGIRDVNADGFEELVASSDTGVTVLKSVPEALWKSHKFKDMKATVLDPAGAIVVQADDALWSIDQATGVTTRGGGVPKGRTLGGRARAEDGTALDYFKGRWDPTPELEHDIDGDGQADVVLTSSGGVVVYNGDGDVLLRIRSGDVELTTGIGDLDGKPGTELAIAVPHYGVVVLGKK